MPAQSHGAQLLSLLPPACPATVCVNVFLQITRAAITTGNGGAVYDVFEIMAEPSAGHEAVTALDVQFHVHQALYKWKTANPAAAAAADQAAGIAIGKRQRL